MAITADRGGSLGSDRRFVQLPDRHLRPARRLPGYMLGGTSEAENAAQGVIARAWRAWPWLREEKPLLERILLKVCSARARRRGRIRVVDVDHQLPLATRDPFKAMLDREAIGRERSLRTPDQRAVVVLRFWRDLCTWPLTDLPWGETAHRPNVPVGTVKSRLHHGLRAAVAAVAMASPAEVNHE
jgi:DNA-directed RNA polymerase specialized sigma24 family protein